MQLVSDTHGFRFEAPYKIRDAVLQFVSETHGLESVVTINTIYAYLLARDGPEIEHLPVICL